MDNTMNFSYMTRFAHAMIKTCQMTGSRTGGTDSVSSGKGVNLGTTQSQFPNFYDKLVEKGESGKDVIESENVSATKEMSMAEYKLYLYDKIAALPVHSSNIYDSVSVQISDAGLEAMKNDPEYERWVLDCLKTNFQYPDPWSSMCGGKFVVFYFGATKEESHAESWRLGFRNGNGQKLFNEKAKDSFWERRKKRREELLAQLEELEEKKALAKRMARSAYFMELSAVRPEMVESAARLDSDQLAMQIFSSFKANILLESFHGKKG